MIDISCYAKKMTNDCGYIDIKMFNYSSFQIDNKNNNLNWCKLMLCFFIRLFLFHTFYRASIFYVKFNFTYKIPKHIFFVLLNGYSISRINNL